MKARIEHKFSGPGKDLPAGLGYPFVFLDKSEPATRVGSREIFRPKLGYTLAELMCPPTIPLIKLLLIGGSLYRV